MSRHAQIRELLACLKMELEALDQSVEEIALRPNLSLAISDWVQARSLSEELKQAKAILDGIVVTFSDDVIPHQLDLHDLTSTNHALGNVKLTHHTKASINTGCKPQAYEWLRDHDLGGIIIETINAQTLAATAKTLLLDGKDLPGNLFTVSQRRYAAFTSKE